MIWIITATALALTLGTSVAGAQWRPDVPQWSPDGRLLVFTRSQNVYVMNADGTGVRRLR